MVALNPSKMGSSTAEAKNNRVVSEVGLGSRVNFLVQNYGIDNLG